MSLEKIQSMKCTKQFETTKTIYNNELSNYIVYFNLGNIHKNLFLTQARETRKKCLV